jgi:hypothetical protein
VVKWAGQTQEIGQIAARGSASATFNVEAPKDMRAGAYPFNVMLDYTGEDRKAGTASFNFEIPVKQKADFEASFSSPALLPGGKKEVAITLSNTGSQDAERLKVRIKPLFPFSTDGTVRYVESLPKGGSANLTYVITVDKDATAGEQVLSFLVDFEDPMGKKFSDTTDFSIPVRSATLTDDVAGLWYVWALLAAVALYAVFGRKRKHAAG